jgi:hypothetical protein
MRRTLPSTPPRSISRCMIRFSTPPASTVPFATASVVASWFPV